MTGKIDLEALKHEVKDVNRWPWDTARSARYKRIIATMIAEIERSSKILEDRWNESTDFGMRILKENEDLREKLALAEQALSDVVRLLAPRHEDAPAVIVNTVSLEAQKALRRIRGREAEESPKGDSD